MTFHGTVTNGVIVLDSPAALPDGTRVDIVVTDQVAAPEGTGPTLLSLLKVAGTAKDLPADFAEQHDHYIHGTPKR